MTLRTQGKSTNEIIKYLLKNDLNFIEQYVRTNG